MNKTILILGGGWGGLTAAHALKSKLPNEHIVVIEKKTSFVFYPSLLRAMIGETNGLKYIESPLKNLLKKDLEIINEEIIKIDPETKTVQTSSQIIKADFIIISMGAELYPETILGFNENCINLFDINEASTINEKLNNFTKGKITFLITSTPFRCPPSPYEAALLTEWYLRKKGVRTDVEISIYTPEKYPMPSAGEAVGESLKHILNSHKIMFYSENKVAKIENDKITFSNNAEANFDLLIGIPPHGAPKAIIDSCLTNSSGYIPTHPQTMEILENVEELTTRFPGVYVIGDCAAIMLLNGMYLPKGGVFAEEQAHVVARNIASIINGEKPTAMFNGQGICYVDIGDNMAVEGSGQFYAYPSPVVNLGVPSIESRKAKHEFERIFEWWFEDYENK